MLNANAISVSVLKTCDELEDFRCEKGEYVDFVRNPDGALSLQQKNLAVTYVFRSDNNPIGFITVTMSSLRKEPPTHGQEQQLGEIPSLLLTHIARDLRYKGEGAGKVMIEWVITLANELAGSVGCRFIIIEIPQEMITLFQQYGFELLPPDRNDRHYVMFFDLGTRKE